MDFNMVMYKLREINQQLSAGRGTRISVISSELAEKKSVLGQNIAT